MKNLLFVFVLLFMVDVFSVSAQETWSVNAPAKDVALVDRARAAWNTSVCARFALSPSCTQAQACTAAGAAGGASCTPAQARAVDVQIFPATLAGRQDFFVFKILLRVRREMLEREQTVIDSEQKCINWRAGNDTIKNAMCAAAGAPIPATVAAGCNLCPD